MRLRQTAAENVQDCAQQLGRNVASMRPRQTAAENSRLIFFTAIRHIQLNLREVIDRHG